MGIVLSNYKELPTFNITSSKWVNGKYKEFFEKHGYLPQYFDVYNGLEIHDIAPTLSTRSNGAMGSGALLIIEVEGGFDGL